MLVSQLSRKIGDIWMRYGVGVIIVAAVVTKEFGAQVDATDVEEALKS